jgi:hypothetical protein
MKSHRGINGKLAVAALAVLAAATGHAQDKYALKVAERNRVLRLQGIRGLGGGLGRPGPTRCSR